jgi:hypothetical protein
MINHELHIIYELHRTYDNDAIHELYMIYDNL